MNNPALVADIGGTNARFAISIDDIVSPETIQVLPCNNYENLEGAVQAYLGNQGVSVTEACMAFACPVSENIKMTNNHWAFNRTEMQETLGLESFKVINDFTAQALALPALKPSELVQIGSGQAVDQATRLIIGPGTGLGVAGLKAVGVNWLPLPGEGGHAAMSAVTDLDIAVLNELRKNNDFIYWESILCGSGLETLYQAHSALAGENQSLKDYEVTQQALAGENVAEQTLHHFCELLGRAASNAALTLGARGGVYIAGGIVPRFLEFFAQSSFRQAFETNVKMVDYLKAIPTYLITADNPGLVGASAAMHNPMV